MQVKQRYFVLSLLAVSLGLGLAGCGQPDASKSSSTASQVASTASPTVEKSALHEQEIAKLTANTVPINTAKNPAAIAKIPHDYKFVNEGYFTVAAITGLPPLSVLAPDNKTDIGTEVDFARLIAIRSCRRNFWTERGLCMASSEWCKNPFGRHSTWWRYTTCRFRGNPEKRHRFG